MGRTSSRGSSPRRGGGRARGAEGMHRRGRPESRPATGRWGLRRRGSVAIIVAAAALVLGAIGGFTSAASAEEEGVLTFPGTPLSVSIGPLGQCESSYTLHGNNYFPPFGSLGDCGFFLAFPSTGTGQPAELKGQTYGFTGAAGPHIPFDGEGGQEYTIGTQSGIEGLGTSASPYAQTTVFYVESSGKRYAEVTERTTYVNGEPQFTSTYTVKNVTASKSKIYFRAIYAGDLYLLGEDFGTGVFFGGPPRFVGGINPSTGAVGGLQEASGALPWTGFQEGCWNETLSESEGRCAGAVPSDAGIWHLVRSTDEAEHAFNETVDPSLIDNAVGVEWDQLRSTGLEFGQQQSFTIVNRTQVPSNLEISPTSQSLTQGQTETLNVKAVDLAGQPYAGKTVHYTVSGANPQSGTVTLSGTGQAQISYVGNNAGIDTIQLFVDLTGSGTQTPGDPGGVAQVTFVPRPPPPPPGPPSPNSSYKVQSVHVNSNGTITIVFVPTQSGSATLEVTVPTASVARNEAIAAKSKKCKRNQIKIKGKCLPKTSLSGKITATGTAGVALKLTVKPSSKVKKALSKGKTVLLTAKLTYKSKLGGKPTVQIYHLKVKGKRPRKHH